MSALSTRGARRRRTLALPAVVAAAVAGMALVAGASTGDTAGSPDATRSVTTGAVVDAGVNVWAANDPALFTAPVPPAALRSSFARRGEIEWTQTGGAP
jgi:hypothetical protein